MNPTEITHGKPEQSAEIDKIAPAFVKAQKKIATVHKDKTANIPGKDGKRGFNYTYADLAACFDAVRDALHENGLAVMQAPSFDTGVVSVSTQLIHESGQWFRSTLGIPGGRDSQSVGSAITYGRRYGLCSMVGLVADVDDDGGGAMPDDDDKGKSQQPPKSPPRTDRPENQKPPENKPPENKPSQDGDKRLPADELRGILRQHCKCVDSKEAFAAIQYATNNFFTSIGEVWADQEACANVIKALRRLHKEKVDLSTLKNKVSQG